MSLIEVKELNKSYKDGEVENHILKDINLTFEKGKFYAIIGKSGSGKSTLLNVISGLDPADSGNVIIDGEDIYSLNDKELSLFRSQKIGFVFQNFNLIPVLSVMENVLLPIRFAKDKIDQDYIEELLDMLELGDKKDVLPSKLSGGQQQRVAIARALANKPEIIFADEPTGNLDSTTGETVIDLLIKGIHRYNQTLIMVTHDQDIADKADVKIAFTSEGIMQN